MPDDPGSAEFDPGIAGVPVFGVSDVPPPLPPGDGLAGGVIVGIAGAIVVPGPGVAVAEEPGAVAGAAAPTGGGVETGAAPGVTLEGATLDAGAGVLAGPVSA